MKFDGIENCFACGKRLVRPEFVFLTDTVREDQHYEVFVGPECFSKVRAAGEAGYQPPRGGPRLYFTSAYATKALETHGN